MIPNVPIQPTALTLPPLEPIVRNWFEAVKAHNFLEDCDKGTLDKILISYQFQADGMDPTVRIEARQMASWAIASIRDRYDGHLQVLKHQLDKTKNRVGKSYMYVVHNGKPLTAKQLDIQVNTDEDVGRLTHQVSDMTRLVDSLKRIERKIDQQQEDLREININYRRETQS